MKTCVDCGCDLPTPLDEFGDIGKERCEHCHLEYLWNDRKSSSELHLLEAIDEANADVENARDELDEAEDRLRDLKKELKEFHKNETQSISNAVLAWINGGTVNA